MDPQPSPPQSAPGVPAVPGTSGPGPSSFGPSSSSNGRSILLWVLVGVLGLGAVVFAILSVVAFGQAHTATTTLAQQKQAAADAARADQKKQDAQAAEIAAETPYRSYVAPVEFGSFEIKFPQNWSASVDEELQGNTQVTLVVHPDFIRRQNNADDLAAAKILLVVRDLDDYVKQYQSQKGLMRTDVTVSGVKGVELAGKFSDKRTSRMVVVPIRDKILVFVNEDAQYSSEFDQILAQSKVLP